MRLAWMRPLVFLLALRVLAAPVSWETPQKALHGHRHLTMRCWPASWLHRVQGPLEERRERVTSRGAADITSASWSRPGPTPHVSREHDLAGARPSAPGRGTIRMRC
jgi:hypothetical protein